MTGFARFETDIQGRLVAWELRSVNGKGLDAKIRLNSGYEALEPDIRRMMSGHLVRGNLQISLQLQKSIGESTPAVNMAVLMDYAAVCDSLVANGHAALPTADGLLALRGVIDQPVDMVVQPDKPLLDEMLLAFASGLDRLISARQAEGREIAQVLMRRLDEMESLVVAAEADDARRPAVIQARLKAQVEALLGTGIGLDEGRLAQEAALLATRADVQEELDRLRAHIAAARTMLAEGGAVGRRLDFLSQEFNRESNTLCAKSNATSLTAIGLQLKVVVDQFREQVQNIE
ncbi:YicC family protein [Aureimonas fodinaquatilis]|uniref:YicC family protein n=2 Tax=Aureimonas fodinaquatilis TaxID=2565783 RepID=A0A5B0DYW4_9HYPH|nr:YicC family protein [Aureimonas fodinaquatilis]